MFASVLISFYFLLTQFPLSVSCNLVLSVSSGLRKIQLLDFAYKLTDWPLRGMQNVDRIKSDRTSNETNREKILQVATSVDLN